MKDAYDRGITTSVISLGRGSDSPELEVLSKVGGGRFYLIEDATKLPAVFTQETILAARSALHEVPFRATPVLPGAPTNGHRLRASSRPSRLRGGDAQAARDDPAGRSGGRSGAGDVERGHRARRRIHQRLQGSLGPRWPTWPDGARLFGQLGRDLARKADDPRVRLEADAAGGELHVRADVVGDDGRAQTFRRLVLHIAGPDGFTRDLPLDAVGAGRYGATLPLSRPGTYVATARDEVNGEPVGTTGAVITAGEELRPTGSDTALLERIAVLTGGHVRDTLAGIFDDRAARRFAYRSLVPTLILVAAMAMLLAVAARRIGVSDTAMALVRRVSAWRAATAALEAERRAELRAAAGACHPRARAAARRHPGKTREGDTRHPRPGPGASPSCRRWCARPDDRQRHGEHPQRPRPRRRIDP